MPTDAEPVSLRDAWIRLRDARKAFGSAQAAFDAARERSSAAIALARAAGGDPSAARAPTLEELDEPEPLSDEEAARIFLGAALHAAPGLEADADALRAGMRADGAGEADIEQAVLALARDHVFGKAGPGTPEAPLPLEHLEWVGEEYALGIGGQRVAIVGFSHWGNPEEEREGVTQDIVAAVCDGRSRAFFDHVQHCFGFDDRAAFWSKVLFFNYLPDLVGTGDNRYAWGTQEQHGRARERFQRILDRRRPDKVFVFSMKAWDSMPPFRPADPLAKPLGSGEFPRSFEWGTYDAGHGGHVTAAFGLRHPQDASMQLTLRAVGRAMDMNLPP